MIADAAIASPERKLAVFGGLHLAIMALTLLLPMVMSLATRRRQRPRMARALAGALAGLLIASWIVALGVGYETGRITRWPQALPMQLCDVSAFVAIVALIWRGQQAYELAYFWGLAATSQAIIAPDISLELPMALAVSFFVQHCGIVIGALFMTWGLHMRPAPGAVGRAFGWTQVYGLTAGFLNWAGNMNFGYLRAKPVHATMLDSFAPWPWYILELEVMALVSFVVFYAPFWIGRRRRRLSPL